MWMWMLCVFWLSKEHLRYMVCLMEMTQTVICARWRQALMFNCFMDTAYQNDQSNNKQNNNANQNFQETKRKWDVWFIPADVWEAGSKLVQILYHRHQISFPTSSPLYNRGEEKDIYPKYEGSLTVESQQSCSALELQGESLEQSIHGCPEWWWQVQEGAWWFIPASSSVDGKTM